MLCETPQLSPVLLPAGPIEPHVPSTVLPVSLAPVASTAAQEQHLHMMATPERGVAPMEHYALESWTMSSLLSKRPPIPEEEET